MTRPSHRSRRLPLAPLWAGMLLAPWAIAPPTGAQPADSLARDSIEVGTVPPAVPRTPDTALADRLLAEGLENITALAPGAGFGAEPGPIVGYENRRYRHSATALGRVARATQGPLLAYERRLSMVAAAIRDPGDGRVPSKVWYPSDGAFPKTPGGPVLAPTSKALDLMIGPLFTYELARLFDPVLVRVELQPELRYNPWPGARARAAVVIPIRNDFEVDSLRPDVNKVRPGPVMIEQYAWSPGAALVSASGGLLGNNRYGLSFGVARPLRNGEILLDSQTDVSGFFAVSDSGINYSTPSRWTGFLGVSYRPPGLDLNVRLRAARYVQNDQGFELELRRAMGDVDVALSFARVWIDGTESEPGFAVTTGAVRLGLPVPPFNRPVTRPVRVLPVERFTFQYREESLPIAVTLANVASREDFLRHLDGPTLASNDPRFQAGRAGKDYRHLEERIHWVSLTGTTGFVNTPWAGVMGDKEAEFGYNRIPKEAAYQYRGKNPSEIYYAALGFLPRTEVGLRWTVMPGGRLLPEVPESKTVDADRMFSARFQVLEPRPLRPGLAVGVEDLRGTRRFHSTYAVAGMPFDIYRLQNRVTLGYAPRVFDRASRRTLDGLFGAYEVTSWRTVAVTVEFDTEKVNSMLGINLGFGLRARMAMLDLEHLAVGAGWFKAL